MYGYEPTAWEEKSRSCLPKSQVPSSYYFPFSHHPLTLASKRSNMYMSRHADTTMWQHWDMAHVCNRSAHTVTWQCWDIAHKYIGMPIPSPCWSKDTPYMWRCVPESSCYGAGTLLVCKQMYPYHHMTVLRYRIQNACVQVCPHCHLTVLEHGIFVNRLAHCELWWFWDPANMWTGMSTLLYHGTVYDSFTHASTW